MRERKLNDWLNGYTHDRSQMEVTMKIIDKKISDLKPYENNPRKNDDAVESVASKSGVSTALRALRDVLRPLDSVRRDDHSARIHFQVS